MHGTRWEFLLLLRFFDADGALMVDDRKQVDVISGAAAPEDKGKNRQSQRLLGHAGIGTRSSDSKVGGFEVPTACTP